MQTSSSALKNRQPKDSFWLILWAWLKICAPQIAQQTQQRWVVASGATQLIQSTVQQSSHGLESRRESGCHRADGHAGKFNDPKAGDFSYFDRTWLTWLVRAPGLNHLDIKFPSVGTKKGHQLMINFGSPVWFRDDISTCEKKAKTRCHLSGSLHV